MFNVGDRVVIKKYDEVKDHYGILPEFWDGYVGSEFTIKRVEKNKFSESYEVMLEEDDLSLFWPIEAMIPVYRFSDTKYAVRIVDLEPDYKPLGIPSRDLTYVEDTIEEAITRGKEYIKEEDGRYMVKIYEFRQLRLHEMRLNL